MDIWIKVFDLIANVLFFFFFKNNYLITLKENVIYKCKFKVSV